MIKIAIVDDEQIYIDKIKNILTDNFDNIHLDTYTSINQITDKHIDLLLLDIDMPDYDGIAYSKNHLDTNIIFVTNYDTRVKQAFGPNVYGFVSKSDLEEELIDCLNKAIKLLNNNDKVILNVNGILVKIDIKEIIYCQYMGSNEVALVYKNKQIFVKQTSLKKIKSKLGNNFIYLDKGIIINKTKINFIEKSCLYLLDINTPFLISRRHKNDILRAFYEG